MPTRRQVLSIAIVTLLLGACSRTPSPIEGRDGAAPASTDATAADNASDADALRDYYASLVVRHGADLSACGPAQDVHADACAAGEDGAATAPARRVLLMLDASGSMAAKQGGQTKLAIAQDALLGFVSQLEGDAQVGLRVYGHRGSNRDADKAQSCLATELVQPFAARDAHTFEAAVRSFQPRGFTPIAASLQAAADDFARGGANASGNVVYLVSDGIETCDGDPATAARALRASDIAVVVNVIGFDVDAQAERQLRGVAQAGGGEYLAARNRRDLDAIFQRRVREATARYNCEVTAQSGAFTATVGSQTARFTCLVGKATSEYTSVVSAASADFIAGRATQAQHDYAMAQAEAKRAGIVEPASAQRTEKVDAVSARREAGMDAAERERDAALERAQRERND